MDLLKVFISSVMRRSLEDLSAERKAARKAVESFPHVARAWDFEKEPASTKLLRDSYIDELKAGDLVLLIVGRVMTPPVREEFDIARDHGKPILAFAKEVSGRNPEAAAVLDILNAKYDRFTDAEDLGLKVKAALGQEILRRAKPVISEPFQSGDRLGKLRAFARKRTIVRISPMIPPCQYDQFSVVHVNNEALKLNKDSNRQEIFVPTSRITEVLVAGDREPPTLKLRGRLQWLTLLERWKFCEESPDPNDPLRLGVPREVGRSQDPFVDSLAQRLESNGLRLAWSRRDKLAQRLSARTHEVFYDDEGRYLVSRGPDVDSVLVISSAHRQRL